MIAAKFVALFLLLALVFNFTCVFVDAGINGGEDLKLDESNGGVGVGSEIELDQLITKIRTLESQIDDKTKELKGREDLVAEKEKLLQERQDKVASSETEVSSLRVMMNKKHKTYIHFDCGYYSVENKVEWKPTLEVHNLVINTYVENVTYLDLVGRVGKKLKINEATTNLKLSYFPLIMDCTRPSFILHDEDVSCYLMEFEDQPRRILHVEVINHESEHNQRDEENVGSAIVRREDCGITISFANKELISNARDDIVLASGTINHYFASVKWDDGMDLILGQEFESKHEVQDIVEKTTHKNCFEFVIVKSDTKRYLLKFREWKNGCNWALRVAKVANNVQGSSEESYMMVYSYMWMLEKMNPGTVSHVELDEDHRFKYIFFALGACIESFQAKRKVIIVDGTHIKTVHGGVLIVVTTQNPNHHHYLIAFGVVDGEKDASWSWYFRMLKAKFRECAQAYTKGEFIRLHHVFMTSYPAGTVYLDKSVDPHKWARCYFPRNRQSSLEIPSTHVLVPVIQYEIHTRCTITKLLTVRELNNFMLEYDVVKKEKKDSSDSTEQLSKAKERAVELEKHVEVRKSFLEQKNKDKESTEARRSEAEKKLSELNSRLEKTHEEQKKKIKKLELKISEEEMLRTKYEATTKAKELMEVHGAWLPPWFLVHWTKFQTVAGTHWDAHGKPVMEKVTQKVTQANNQAEKWAKPHMANVKTKYIPAMKETFKTHVEPHVQTLSSKAKESYHASKSAVTPHIVKFQEHVDPYYQEAKKFSKPYVDQVATATKPHVDKVRAIVKPYTKKAIHLYKEFLKSATTYHHQLQANVERKLKSHELMEPFATKEFIWFSASALLALPIFIVYKFLCSLFRTKTKKPTRQTHHHTRRKTKRGHSEQVK